MEQTQPEEARYKYTGKRRLYIVLAIAWFGVGISLLSFAGYKLLANDSGEGQLIWVRPDYQPEEAVAGSAAEPVGDQGFRLVIDKLGIDAPVSAYGLDENGAPQVPFEAGLVAWYHFSAYPGSGDNAVFAGHVTWRGDAVFKRLGELQAGDRVMIKADDGRHLVYEVTDSLLVEPTEDAARQWMDANGQNVITLITCGGDRRPTDDFFGAEYDKRQVVRARLVAAA